MRLRNTEEESYRGKKKEVFRNSGGTMYEKKSEIKKDIRKAGQTEHNRESNQERKRKSV